MRGNKQILLILSCGGMAFTWRYAWALFLCLVILTRPFPLPEAAAVFAMAAAITTARGPKNRRVYQAAAFHIIGFTLAWLLTTYRLFYSGLSIFSLSWIQNWLGQMQELRHCLMHLTIFGCLLLFWSGARALVKSPLSYYPVCLQFDKGLGALFALLLVNFTMEVKGGIILKDPVTPYLLVAFIVFSLIAISLSRDQSGAQKAFRPGYHHIGIVLSFVSIIFFCGAALAFLFLPYLTLLADSVQVVLKETTAPLGVALTNIIRFLFSIGRYRREIGNPSSSGSDAEHFPRIDKGPPPGLSEILLWAIAVIVLVASLYLIFLMVRRLLKRNRIDTSDRASMSFLNLLISMICNILQASWNGLVFLLKRIDSAAAAYAGLLRWGRRSGFTAAASETPVEYGTRLGQRFPLLQTEIELIIEAFNCELYGQRPADRTVLTGIHSARRRMRNPRHWPSRARAWFAMPSSKVQASKVNRGP